MREYAVAFNDKGFLYIEDVNKGMTWEAAVELLRIVAPQVAYKLAIRNKIQELEAAINE